METSVSAQVLAKPWHLTESALLVTSPAPLVSPTTDRQAAVHRADREPYSRTVVVSVLRAQL